MLAKTNSPPNVRMLDIMDLLLRKILMMNIKIFTNKKNPNIMPPIYMRRAMKALARLVMNIASSFRNRIHKPPYIKVIIVYHNMTKLANKR